MSQDPRSTHRLSFATRDPELSRGTPDSLRELRALRSSFDQERDPLIRAQLTDMGKSEAQRRKALGRHSRMVRLHKPFPELKPKQEMAPIRAAFNREWLREFRAARRAELAAKREHEKTLERDVIDYPGLGSDLEW